MKNTIAVLLVILCLIPSMCFAEDNASSNDWFMSDDGMIEFKIVSIDTSGFPYIKVNHKYRLDGEKETNGTWNYRGDLSAEINAYIAEHPTYKNRKVPVTTKQTLDSLKCKGGTVYYAYLTFIIRKDNPKEVQKLFWTDIADVFPDDIINYDAHNAARAIKASAEKLNLSNYSVKNCFAATSKKFNSVSYYTFTLVDGTWAKNYLAIFSGSNYAVILYDENNLLSLMTEVSVLINNSSVLGNPKYDTKCASFIADYMDIEDTSSYYLGSIAKYLD